MAIKITIENPCSQDWNSMKNIESGRFCNFCSKTVTDFTNLSNKEISVFFSKNENVCGRLKSSQLNRIIAEPRTSNSINKFALGAFLLFPFVSKASFQNLKFLQTSVFNVNKFHLDKKTIHSGIKKDSLEFNGTVYDGNDSTKLAGVIITLKGTNTGTITDVLGNFTFKISEEYRNKENYVFQVNSVGFISLEVSLNKSELSEHKKYYLEQDTVHLNEKVLIGSVICIKENGWHKIKRKVKNVFKSN